MADDWGKFICRFLGSSVVSVEHLGKIMSQVENIGKYFIHTEKLTVEPESNAQKPAATTTANKWDGEDEDEIKVSIARISQAENPISYT